MTVLMMLNKTKQAPVVDPYARDEDNFRDPPQRFSGILRQLGPGVILLGGIVGSGELIMTTKLGAEAGFFMLWLVFVSCFGKFIVQAELARHTISSGKTFLEVFSTLPGPRFQRPAWLTPEWIAIVLLLSFIGLGVYTLLGEQRTALSEVGIGAAIVIGAVISGAVIAVHRKNRRQGLFRMETTGPRPIINWFMCLWLSIPLLLFINGGAILGGAGQALQLAFPDLLGSGGSTKWGVIVAVVCAGLLIGGKYSALERMSLGLVSTFTLTTIVCTVLLQWTGFAVTPEDLRQGLDFSFPSPLGAGVTLTALAMYAGTGVSWGEMCSYTYFCVEKGYARFTGANVPGPEWPLRARGWIRVMYTDVLVALVVYTVGTVCFYFLGAAILNRMQLNPDGPETLRTLGLVYTESLGSWAATLFVVGAFVVLFSTVLTGVAGFSRWIADTFCVLGFIDRADYLGRLRVIRVLIIVTLGLYSFSYSLFENPPLMLMMSSMMAVFMYPILGLGTLYLRYHDVDKRILPGRLTTAWLWICGITLALVTPGAALLALAISQGWVQLFYG